MSASMLKIPQRGEMFPNIILINHKGSNISRSVTTYQSQMRVFLSPLSTSPFSSAPPLTSSDLSTHRPPWESGNGWDFEGGDFCFTFLMPFGVEN